MREVAAVLLLLVAGACSDSQEPQCNAPASTTYTCQPLPAGSPGCAGGPVWRSVYSESGGDHQDDTSAIFPDGCSARIPECSQNFIGDARAFQCFAGPGELGRWEELL